MNGTPWNEKETKYMTSTQIWDFLSNHLSAGDTVTATSGVGSDTRKDKWGIALGHAYSISRILTLKDGTKLVRARNPWGKDSYWGQYGSDSPQAKDPAVVAQIPDIQDDKDGYIYVPIDQFKVSFSEVKANYNGDKMKMDYYLKLDDKADPERETNMSSFLKRSCGKNCILHDLHVVSKKAQKVWVSLNTWRAATMPDGCMSQNRDATNFLYPTPNRRWEMVASDYGGMMQAGPYAFEADTYLTVSIALQLSGDVPKDWSVVAWGESGDVFVYNVDGSESSHWAMGDSMKRFGAQTKPAFSTEGLTELKLPNMNSQPKQTVVPNPVTPDPPKIDPVKKFRSWIPTAANGAGYQNQVENIRGARF